jgi:hypothetical protein
MRKRENLVRRKWGISKNMFDDEFSNYRVRTWTAWQSWGISLLPVGNDLSNIGFQYEIVGCSRQSDCESIHTARHNLNALAPIMTILNETDT